MTEQGIILVVPPFLLHSILLITCSSTSKGDFSLQEQASVLSFTHFSAMQGGHWHLVEGISLIWEIFGLHVSCLFSMETLPPLYRLGVEHQGFPFTEHTTLVIKYIWSVVLYDYETLMTVKEKERDWFLLK